jgi:Zn-dependent protease with chaperone function
MQLLKVFFWTYLMRIFLVLSAVFFAFLSIFSLAPAQAGQLERFMNLDSSAGDRCDLAASINKSLKAIHPDLVGERPSSFSKSPSSIAAISSPGLRRINSYFSISNPKKSFQLMILNSKNTNAFAQSAHQEDSRSAAVVLSSSLLSQISNEAELAFVLAHEIAHITNDHFVPDTSFIFSSSQLQQIKKIRQSWESDADLEAISALRRAGIKISSASVLLDKLHKNRRSGEKIDKGFHIHTKRRVDKLYKLALNHY